MFAIDEILATSDFFNIGTNDLTQFILAADRNALAMIDGYTVLHLYGVADKKGTGRWQDQPRFEAGPVRGGRRGPVNAIAF